MPPAVLSNVGLLALLFAAALPSCQTEALAERRMQAVSASSPTPSPASPRVATREERKAMLDRLTRPERDAPADARTAAGGVLWTLFAAGTGAPPDPEQAVTADVTVWNTDGSLVLSTYDDVAGLTFELQRLPPGLRAEVVQVRPGGHARFWLPASALAGWKPSEWPSDDLIIDYQLIQARSGATRQVSVASQQKPPAASAPILPPAPGEPPPAARRTEDGVAHLSLREGEDTPPAHSDTLKLRINAWTVRALMVSKLLEGHELAIRLDRTSPLLRPTLARMKAGGVERLWLPASLADSVLPKTEGKPTVIDVELLDISG